jgi:protein SCO1/2
MKLWLLSLGAFLSALLLWLPAKASESPSPSNTSASSPRVFAASGVIREIQPDTGTVVIRHGAISNYMEGMTMPFKVKVPAELAGFQRGDQITFQLHVTETESWVDHLVKTGTVPLAAAQATSGTPSGETALARLRNALLDYKFTNELGQAVSLNDFRGQALAITFFYTRCPLPDYCPRLSKNFQEASQKLKSMPGAPANWHFISVSFDPEFDSPAMLKAYGESYGYDPAHWSFLTGPGEMIGKLAHAAGVNYKSEDGSINHNFRTLIVDPTGHLQMIFVTGGNLSDQIVAEILKAAVVSTNQSVAQNQ